MIFNSVRSTKTLVNAIALTLVSYIAIPASHAQTAEPIAELPPAPLASPSSANGVTSPQTTMPSSEVKPPESLPAESEAAPGQRNYIGVGGVVGLQGDTTSLSQGAFSIVGKQVLTRNLAIHTADTVFGRSTASSSVALTYNHPIRYEGSPLVFIPFLGGGIMLHNNHGLKVNPMITGGIDIDTPQHITGTVRINSGFVRDRSADVGIILGVGYNY
jgi:hypothetical protein